mgnify:CR=1 FL=1
MRVPSELPLRGPELYEEEDKRYEFEMLEGNIEDGFLIHLGHEDRNFTPCKSSNIRL